MKICKESGDKAACYHVARQYENSKETDLAIDFFTRAGAYANAVRLCKVIFVQKVHRLQNRRTLSQSYTVYNIDETLCQSYIA